MEIKEIKEKEIWENFLIECKEKTFLQSWYWGEFQKMMGNKIWRIGIFEKEQLVSLALMSKIKAKRGTFLLIQHGPNIKPQKEKQSVQILRFLLEELKKIGKEENCDFIRIAPLWEENEENIKLFKYLGFKNSPIHASAYEATWKLDITVSEEELFKNMRKTTRYLIQQTRKNEEITIEKSENLTDIEIYQKLNKEVAKKQKFTPFSDEYLKKEFEIFLEDKKAILLFGKYKGFITAGALIIFWSNIGFYHQAASSLKYAKLSIPYLLQWEAIKESKKRNCHLYDFWGYIDPKKQLKHPWAGPTLFKMGFGGKPYEYLKTQDFPLSKKYWLIYIFEKIRKIKRGL